MMRRVRTEEDTASELDLRRSKPSRMTLPYQYIPGDPKRKNLQELVPTYVEDENQGGSAKVYKEGQVTFNTFAVAIETEDLWKLQKILMTPLETMELFDHITLTSVLHVAAKHDNSELWTTLARSPVLHILRDSQDIRGTTPLIAAAWYNNVVAVGILLNQKVDTRKFIYDTKKTALHIASDLPDSSICRAIMEYDHETGFVEMLDIDGNTPLMVAMMANSPCVQVLLELGADFTKKNSITKRNVLHMAVVNRNHPMVRYLIENNKQLDFINARDVNDFTPLKLALRQRDLTAMLPFLNSPLNVEMYPYISKSLHALVRSNHWRIIEELLDHQYNYLNVADSEGETLLMYATRLSRVQIVYLLLEKKVNIRVRNEINGESVLHAAAYSNSEQITEIILNAPGIGDIFNEVDYSGLTAYEIIIGKAGFEIWSMYMNTGFVDRKFLNINDETTLFIAAKEGNYLLVRCLLMSESCRIYYEKEEIMNDEDVFIFEIQNKIYTSDVYAILGAEVESRAWEETPAQETLFSRNNKGQNIFHACALGQNLECLTFIYNYCSRFVKNHVTDFDLPDHYGNTPLDFAILSGSTDVAKFFINNGANVAHRNARGQTPLDAININIDDFYKMFRECINECAVLDLSQRKDPINYMIISYKVLCPPGYPQMDVLSLLFFHLEISETHRNKYIEILKNPIIEYFVLYKWSKLKKIVELRFLLSTLMAAVFSTYLTFKLCVFLTLPITIMQILWWVSFLLSSIIVLFSIPVVYMGRLFCFSVLFLASFSAMVYLLLDRHDRLSLEVAAVSILLSWLSIIIQGYISNRSFQVAMFHQVVRSVVSHLPMCILILFAFSNCFFTLFHNFFSFNNPFHSFITTAVYFAGHGLQFPMFGEEAFPFFVENKYSVEDEEHENIVARNEVWNVVVEGSLLLLFRVLVCVCVLDMLIRLAVREGEELELEGKIHQTRVYVDEIRTWENFIETKFYRTIHKYHLSWLFGVPRRLKERLSIPTMLHPFSEPVEGFRMFDLKYVAMDIESQEPTETKNLLDMIQEEKVYQFRGSLRRGSRAAGHLKWIYK